MFDWNRACRVTSFSDPSDKRATTLSRAADRIPISRSAGSTRSPATRGASGEPKGVPAAIQSRRVRAVARVLSVGSTLTGPTPGSIGVGTGYAINLDSPDPLRQAYSPRGLWLGPRSPAPPG